MKAFLPGDRLSLFLGALSRQIEVIAPLATESGPIFATWRGQSLDLKSKILSPTTEFLLPHKEMLFRYVQESGHYAFKEEQIHSRLLFGVRPCDLHALTVLDKIFGQKPVDQAYLRRRRATAIVALNCTTPAGECFCTAMGAGPEAVDPCDLQLTEIGDGFFCEAETPAGILALNAGADLLEPAEPMHHQEKASFLQKARESMTLDRSYAQIKKSMQAADWDALGRVCLDCSGCTFVCPVCHCFNILDLGVPDGERLRCRDSCLLSGFSRLTGGANPRSTSGQRLQHWYQDKFEVIPQITGLPGCVGCGRCNLVCPAPIDRINFKVESCAAKSGLEARI
jgi:sulfhydrogenase subunit beta (sulfur reductase)